VPVERAAEVSVSYQDSQRSEEPEGQGPPCSRVQHEMDHLNGVLLVDRMSAVRRSALPVS